MRVFMFALSLLLAWPVGAIAQERTAEDGDYPPTYQGATFTGVVSAVNKATGEITLTYTAPNPKNSETFVGVLEKGYTVKLADGSKQPLLAAKIPAGARMKVFYLQSRKKIDGKKVTVNVIFNIESAPNVIDRATEFKSFR